MELIRWTNGKGYTLMADGIEEFKLLKLNLDYYLKHDARFSDKLEIDESTLAEDKRLSEKLRKGLEANK